MSPLRRGRTSRSFTRTLDRLRVSPHSTSQPLRRRLRASHLTSHLLQAVCQKVLQRQADSRILYLSCDSFINQFMLAVERATRPPGLPAHIAWTSQVPATTGLLFADSGLANPASGDFSFRAINTAAGVGTIDVYLTPPGTDQNFAPKSLPSGLFARCRCLCKRPAKEHEAVRHRSCCARRTQS